MESYVVQRGDTLYGIAKRFDTNVQSIIDINNLEGSSIYPGQTLLITNDGYNNSSTCVSYTVQRGDSLYSIAKKYNTTVNELKSYNRLTSNNLSIGQVLIIPCSEEESSDNDSISNYVSYVVKSGDSLYSIAKMYGTTVDKIKKDNNLINNNLSVGSILLIEDNLGVTVVEECFGEDFSIPNDSFVYIVQKGDSLYSIAKMFNTTVADIQSLNNLSNINLSIGQELMIPMTNTNGTSYVVQKGESLYSIAKKFNTTVSELKRKNNLTSNLLSVGQELII
ncbi:MAG: LysM peptidoglycan-binding domain-containing protein [Bacilli bacterium]|nr:LysM peptidoglycan-binding domain-containing protein [Bacilli bacterium]